MTDRNSVIERAIRFIESGSHTQIARDTMTDELRELLTQQVQADAGAVDLLKRLKRDLMHTRRFGSDTLQAFKNACSQAEGDIEEWLNEHRAAMSREQSQEKGGERG